MFQSPTLSVYLDRAWLGLRFLRAVILYNLPDVLVYIRVINSSQAIRVVQLMCTFICIVSPPTPCIPELIANYKEDSAWKGCVIPRSG